MFNHRRGLALMCLGAMLALILFATEPAAPQSAVARSQYRLSFPAVRRSFPLPTATPTATATPRPTRTPTTYITVQNDLDCILRLSLYEVNGPAHFSWTIAPNTSVLYHINPGEYDWYASSVCCGEGTGRQYLTNGYVWTFWCSSGAGKALEADMAR